MYSVDLKRRNAGVSDGSGAVVAEQDAPRQPTTANASVAAGKVYTDDFDLLDKSEQAIKHQYDPKTRAWARTLINVVVETQHFAAGNLRTAFHMRDLSVAGDDSRYVLKMSKDPEEETQTYYADVEMQMEAKMYAELYNATNPPKRVDFLDAYVLELKDRPNTPICAVEMYIDGEYKKFNNNWSWSDDERNTPQAFSHFTFERSNRSILVCDIQGVGDTWTDPQIHSHNGEGYGKGNMGIDGINRFLESHTCNQICGYLQLPPRGGGVAVLSDQGTMIRDRPHGGVENQRRGSDGEPRVQKGICDVCRCPVYVDQERTKNQRGAYVHINRMDCVSAGGDGCVGVGGGDGMGGGFDRRGERALVEQAVREKNQVRLEKEELARQKNALESELAHIKAQRRQDMKAEVVRHKAHQHQKNVQPQAPAHISSGTLLASPAKQVPQHVASKLQETFAFTAAQVERAFVALGEAANEEAIANFLFEEAERAPNNPPQSAAARVQAPQSSESEQQRVVQDAVSRLKAMGFTSAQIESAQTACCIESPSRNADLKVLSEWYLSLLSLPMHLCTFHTKRVCAHFQRTCSTVLCMAHFLFHFLIVLEFIVCFLVGF